MRQHHARSILCLPLLNRAKLIGVLYLENNLTSHVFTPARIAVLKLLASQAAISLENADALRRAAPQRSLPGGGPEDQPHRHVGLASSDGKARLVGRELPRSRL